MKKLSHIALVATASLTLAGCQSPFFASLGFGKTDKRMREAPAQVAGAQLVEEGRTYLAQGRISAAVASFRLARMDPTSVAQAENGLGVAYAKLGRFDLADRYFRSAVAHAPEDMRFTANLLRLQRDVMLARSATAERLAAAERVAPVAAPVAQAEDAPRNMRVANGVLHITSPEALAARPQMEIAFREKPEPKVLAAMTEAEPAPAAPAVEESKQKLIVVPQ